MAITLTTLYGSSTALEADALEQLAVRLSGRLLTPGSAGYDDARSIWNAMIDCRPGLIVRCAGADDVAHAVRFARDHDLLLAVKGGGHNIAGNALCEGMVIDLSAMRSVAVDPLGRTARVEGGALLGDVDRAAQEHGLAVPLGINSTTGVAGLTLGGGFGWLSRSLGLSSDNLLAAEVVTANGELLRASPAENSDLFWGIRGGGGNFGVVTSFQFKLHPVGPEVLSGLVIHPLDRAKDVLQFYREFLPQTPEEFVCWFVLRKAPPAPFVPPEWHGKDVLVLAMCWSGDDLGMGERIAGPLRRYGRPIVDVVARQPYAQWQTAFDAMLGPGARNYWKSHDFTEVSDGLIDVLVEHARRIPDPQCDIAFGQVGGAVNRVPRDATAFARRDAEFVLNVHGRWADPAKDAECVSWARGLYQAATPYATGSVYVNFLTQEEGDRVRMAYGPNYDRLGRLKAKYDPNNLFRVNQNIRPLAYA